MKRSEMVSKMLSQIKFVEKWHPHDDYNRMDLFLQFIESEGMLPPINTKANPATISAGEANEWEPENET